MNEQGFIEIVSGRRRGIGAGVARAGLAVAEIGFGAAAGARGWLYERGVLSSYAADRAVVSVGNITTGGTGKTPVVRWLCGALAREGLASAVLLRGYRAGSAGSDEAALLRQTVEVVTADADRVRAARRVCEQHPDVKVLVLDDGFQHRRLSRDLDLVLIDATCPFGFGRLLPRGLLREGIGALRRADAILMTRVEQVGAAALAELEGKLRTASGGKEVYRCAFEVAGWDGPRGGEGPNGKCLAVCGIGNPGAFERTARIAGADVAGVMALADHYEYRASDVGRIANQAAAVGAAAVVTTEKDWVKLGRVAGAERRVGGLEAFVLRIAARVERERELLDGVVAAVRAKEGRTAEG